MKPETEAPLALRPRQAARMLGVSPRTLFEWQRRGLLPFTRIGRTVLFPVDGLKRWLSERAAQQAGLAGQATDKGPADAQ